VEAVQFEHLRKCVQQSIEAAAVGVSKAARELGRCHRLELAQGQAPSGGAHQHVDDGSLWWCRGQGRTGGNRFRRRGGRAANGLGEAEEGRQRV
jgi:hypothetical protein